MKRIFKNSLIKNLGIYTILNLVNSSIPFLLLPILTKYLSTYDYGVVDMFINMNFILLPLLGLNVGASIIRFYFLENIDFAKIVRVVITYILFFGLISVIVIAFGLYFFETNFFKDSMPKSILVCSAVYVVFSQLIEVLLNIWRAEEKAINYGILRVTKTIFDLGLSLYFIVILKMDWQGRVYPILFTSLILGITSLIIIHNKYNLEFEIDKIIRKKILNYTLPLIFHSLSGFLISFSDRFLIMYFIDIESVGVYSVAYQIGMIMSFINNSFNQAYSPFLFSKLKEGKQSTIKKLMNVNYYYFLLMISLAIVIYLFVPFIYDKLIDKQFYASTEIVLWVLLGYSFNGMYKIIVNYLFYYKKTKSIAYITLFSALTNIVFCFILIPRMGIIGASISTTIAFGMMFILVYIKYQKIDFNEEID